MNMKSKNSFLIEDYLATAAPKSKSLSGPSVDIRRRLSNEDTDSLF